MKNHDFVCTIWNFAVLISFSFVNKLYFLTWGYQLFHVFYEAFVLGFMNDILVLKILNCIYSTVITIMIYLITIIITDIDKRTKILYNSYQKQGIIKKYRLFATVQSHTNHGELYGE